MRVGRSAAILALTGMVVALVGCGSGSGGGSGGGSPMPSTDTGHPSHSASSSAHPAPLPPKFPTAAGFTRTGGWAEHYDIGNVLGPLTTVGALVNAQVDTDGTAGITVLDAATGKLRWLSPRVEHIVANGVQNPKPSVLPVVVDGTGYVAVLFEEKKSGGGLAKDIDKPAVALFPTGASRSAVQSARTVTLPYDSDSGVRIRPGGSAILVKDDDDSKARSLDPATGKLKPFDASGKSRDDMCSICVGDPGITAFANGKPVLTSPGDSTGFWVDGGWTSKDAAPEGADRDTGDLTVAAGGNLLAHWSKKSDGGLWAVLDPATGKPRAVADCSAAATEVDTDDTSLSPNGRYLVAGNTFFDLKTGKGRCFPETDTRKPVYLVSVGDDGTAYGSSKGGFNARSVDKDAQGGTLSVDIATGKPTILPKNAKVPFAVFQRTALFAYGKDGSGPIVAYGHR